MEHPGAPGLAVPAVAERVFGDRVALAVRYAEMLASDGVLRGLIGPRESDRLWERHLLNCAVVAELIAPGSFVGDIGSGAGLPGIPLAIARPDLRIDLVEPMERRVGFLRDVVAELALDGVTVTRSRGEDAPRDQYDVVAARALAPLERLVPMVLPLARVGGTLLAMKGSTAAAELSAASPVIDRAGGSSGDLVAVGTGLVDPPTMVVVVRRLRPSAAAGRPVAAPARERKHG